MSDQNKDSSIFREHSDELTRICTLSGPARQSLAIKLYSNYVIDELEKQEILDSGASAGADKLIQHCVNRVDEHGEKVWKAFESVEAFKDTVKKMKKVQEDDAVAISSKKRRVSPAPDGTVNKAYVVGSIKGQVTADHLQLLNVKLSDLHPEWVQFGRALYLNEVAIDGIKSKGSGRDENRKKLQEVLVKWKRKGGRRTWRVIHSALLNIKRNDTAGNILAKYPNLDSDVPYDNDGYVAIMTEALVDVISEWELFAQQLGLTNATIQEINGDSRPGKCFNQLLQEWIRLNGSEANIVCILEACERMENTELAEKLRADKDIHCAFPVLTDAEQ